jgi:hypothetical protein
MNQFRKLAQHIEQNQMWVFWIVCVVLAALQYYAGLQHFYWDAERYWECGREFKQNDTFSLYFHTTTRGVLFPLFNFWVIEVLGYLNWHEISVFKCVNTVFVTWGIWFVIPSLYAKATSKVVSVYQKLLLVGLVNAFWFRYFSCPLTDFMCLFLLLNGFDILWQKNVTWWQFLVVGLICGYVFNTRPIYNGLLVVYPVFLLFTHKAWLKKIAGITLLLAASFAINIPQYKLNEKVWNVKSFFQPTDAYYGGRSLYLIQLQWGLYIQKYETYVGDFDCYKSPQVFFFRDRVKSAQTKLEADQLQSFADVLRYVKTHPMMLLHYAKSSFNGLDIQYNTPYIYQLPRNPLFAFFNYAVWFLTCLILYRKVGRFNWSFPFIVLMGYVLFVCSVCIPMAVEVRFFAPLYFGAYALLAFNPNVLFQFFKTATLQVKLFTLATFIVFQLLCFWLSNLTYLQLEFPVLC